MPKKISLGSLLKSAVFTLFKNAGKVKPTRTRKPQRHFGYPSRANPQSIAHYDASIRAWIDGGREGSRPSRRVKPRSVKA